MASFGFAENTNADGEEGVRVGTGPVKELSPGSGYVIVVEGNQALSYWGGVRQCERARHVPISPTQNLPVATSSWTHPGWP